MRTHILKILILQLAILVTGALYSQEKVFYGKVVDNKTKVPIPGVYLVLNGIAVSFTNEKGVFELSCDPSKDKIIVFHHLAYEPDSIEFKKLKLDTTSISLQEKYNELREVSVSAERIKSLLKRAHKQYVKTYRPYCYWAQSNYKQSISYNGESCGYLECTGYTFLPVTDRMVWLGVLSIVPQELRRTRENPLVLQGNDKGNNDLHQLGPNQIYRNLSAYAFFERIHPLAKFDFNNYEFRFDSIEGENSNDYVLIFKQKKMVNITGWPIIGNTGKIWLDHESLNIRKITSTFYWTIRVVQTEVSYVNIEGVTYPEKIKLNTLLNFGEARKSIKKLYSEVEMDFLKIDTIPRPNYSALKNHMYYKIICILPDYAYHPFFWTRNPANPYWDKIINEISSGDQDNEFYLGAKEPIFSQKGSYYKVHTGIIKESSLKFVEQMKKDLNIKE